MMRLRWDNKRNGKVLCSAKHKGIKIVVEQREGYMLIFAIWPDVDGFYVKLFVSHYGWLRAAKLKSHKLLARALEMKKGCE